MCCRQGREIGREGNDTFGEHSWVGQEGLGRGGARELQNKTVTQTKPKVSFSSRKGQRGGEPGAGGGGGDGAGARSAGRGGGAGDGESPDWDSFSWSKTGGRANGKQI